MYSSDDSELQRQQGRAYAAPTILFVATSKRSDSESQIALQKRGVDGGSRYSSLSRPH